jgi:Flp pilus assembly protein TadG
MKQQRIPGKRRIQTRGNSLLEFTLVGIPLIFIIIATFEMSRGMWGYQTLAFAVKSGVRYAIVHGQDCAQAPNTCTVTISQIASKISNAGVGLPSSQVTLTFTDANNTVTTCSLSNCIANYNLSAWPPPSANAPGQDVRISGTYSFRTAMVMFWPGSGQPIGSPAIYNLSADSREAVQY